METSATRQTYCLPVVTSSPKQILEAFRLHTTSIAREAGAPSIQRWHTIRGIPVTRICIVDSGRR